MPSGEEDDGSPQDELGVHRPVQGPRELLAQLQDDGESEAAEDDRRRYRQADERVIDESDEVVGVERESGVVERRDRVEGGEPGGFPEVIAVPPQEPGKEQRRMLRLR